MTYTKPLAGLENDSFHKEMSQAEKDYYDPVNGFFTQSEQYGIQFYQWRIITPTRNNAVFVDWQKTQAHVASTTKDPTHTGST
mgnify:CR=1 FL=1